MLGCSTICPKCKHEFTCCSPVSPPALTCCSNSSSTTTTRRSLHVLSGGGLISTTTTTTTTTTGLVPPISPCLSPQVSPSVPLTFAMPPMAPLVPTGTGPPSDNKPETELQHLTDTVRGLRLSGWYYEGLTYDQSYDLLKETPVGTFLVRNSTNPRYLFSLSVQTERGPTSVRLHYINGYFRLDAQLHLESAMPMFPSVIDLVQHYMHQSKLCRNNAQVWVDNQGQWYSPIVLSKPLVRQDAPSSLKHLARLAVHKALLRPQLNQLELPNSLTAYLAEYPHSI